MPIIIGTHQHFHINLFLFESQKINYNVDYTGLGKLGIVFFYVRVYLLFSIFLFQMLANAFVLA